MDIVCCTSLPGRVEAIVLDATGERAAVVSGQARPDHYADEPPGHHLHLYRFRAGKLDKDKSLSLLAYGVGARTSGNVRWRFPASRVAFRDERTLLVLRSVQRFPADRPEGSTELIGIDLETGEEVGHYEVPNYDYYPSLLSLSPSHALLGRANTAVCVDVISFQEVWNAQTAGDRGGALGVDEEPDEYVAPNGYAYDARAGRLWLSHRSRHIDRGKPIHDAADLHGGTVRRRGYAERLPDADPHRRDAAGGRA